MIGIIDYGMGNLRSVQKAFEYLGYEAEICADPAALSRSDRVILPGVGAFCKAIETLRGLKFDQALQEICSRQVPLLGICLGMQLLCERSYENGVFEGLGLLPGEIVRLPDTVKVPHIGWNSLNIHQKDPLFSGLDQEAFVYFVHSYYLKTEEPVVLASTSYGVEIAASAGRNNVYACQFHPEKSGDTGLEILRNFARI